MNNGFCVLHTSSFDNDIINSRYEPFGSRLASGVAMPRAVTWSLDMDKCVNLGL